MSGRTMSLQRQMTLLVLFWVSWTWYGVSESLGPQCDNGKLSLERDIPAGAVHWDCPVSSWPVSSQEPPDVIDTVYDPEPARQICMGTSISYNCTIPNSGAFRPVGAESGEYLYCPPQRWLNNLHNEAIVLLYHPCAPLHERVFLSVLAQSCLPDYIVTPHEGLKKHRPIALVSWGSTLELSTMATSSVCNWLEATTSWRKKSGDVSRNRNYNLLLMWSAETHRRLQAYPEENPAKRKTLRQCCEQTLSSHLNSVMEAEEVSLMKKTMSFKQFKEDGKIRRIRNVNGEKQKSHSEENTTTHVSKFLSNQTNGKGDNQKHNSTLGSSADSLSESRTLSYPQGLSKAPSHHDIKNINQSLIHSPTASLASNMLETAPRMDLESQKIRLTLQKAAQLPRTKNTGLRSPKPSASFKFLTDGVDSEHNHAARPETKAISSKNGGTESTEEKDKDSALKDNGPKEKHTEKKVTVDSIMKDIKIVDVKERELEQRKTHSDTHSHNHSVKTGSDSVFKSQPQTHINSKQHPNHQPASFLPKRHGCGGCKEGEQCDCTKDSQTESNAAFVNKGLPRTPRSEEALWAASALGFLLILLTLSVLHTRLYRHWRTSPSLYWHDPKQDYDSVADVIRRRIRIAKRRQKRSRRQECVLVPSSSSSDELL
ncbi:tumor protein p53-inducible protein 13 isoform X2 [Cheilinus undulatus]|uniref:tumor protein p53-inducible protein 13 isoform X2 n=1 Tax=Cheilinus undulatus TaxID=241271 RepID=UPI001BD67462|nr:tumor protein p53-inducible protein 13 isoform X2 [Cheilinus undulatus]